VRLASSRLTAWSITALATSTAATAAATPRHTPHRTARALMAPACARQGGPAKTAARTRAPATAPDTASARAASAFAARPGLATRALSSRVHMGAAVTACVATAVRASAPPRGWERHVLSGAVRTTALGRGGAWRVAASARTGGTASTVRTMAVPRRQRARRARVTAVVMVAYATARLEQQGSTAPIARPSSHSQSRCSARSIATGAARACMVRVCVALAGLAARAARPRAASAASMAGARGGSAHARRDGRGPAAPKAAHAPRGATATACATRQQAAVSVTSDGAATGVRLTLVLRTVGAEACACTGRVRARHPGAELRARCTQTARSSATIAASASQGK